MDMDIGSSLRARAKKTYVELELAVDGYGYRFLFARPRKYDLHFISHPFFLHFFSHRCTHKIIIGQSISLHFCEYSCFAVPFAYPRKQDLIFELLPTRISKRSTL